MFQSTPPRGGRHRWYSEVEAKEKVSIHAPARGATFSFDATATSFLFQSTPPRGGRLNHPGQCVNRRDVSIHAPARGATPVWSGEVMP